MTIKIVEIFPSIHGEVNGHHQGRLVTFIRISGCNLRCSWCDSKHTQDGKFGADYSVENILDIVEEIDNKYICLTGGEPLLNSNIYNLLFTLWKKGYKISVETNGTIDITPFFRFVESFIIDYKWKYKDKMIIGNHIMLRESDVIKFPIEDENSFNNCVRVAMYALINGSKAILAFSPIEEFVSPKKLMNWINELETFERNNFLLNIQIHKKLGFL